MRRLHRCESGASDTFKFAGLKNHAEPKQLTRGRSNGVVVLLRDIQMDIIVDSRVLGEGLQHTEFVFVGVGHHEPIDMTLADIDSSCSEIEQALDFRALLGGWSNVEV